MKLTRRMGIAGALAASWLLASACSDEEQATSNDGGSNESGPMNTGGAAKSSGGAGGRAGAGGSSGKGGAGGAVTGGTSATGGGTQTGGKAGAGGGATGGVGTGGSSGGTGGGGAGGGTASGGADASTEGGSNDAGNGADAGVRVPKGCSYACNTDADCLHGPDASADATYKCNPTRKRCENPIEMCNVNDDCLVFASFWFVSPCTSDLDCFPGDVCIDAGGAGFCATPAPTDGGSCFLPPDRVTRHRFGAPDGGTIDVCGDTTGRCDKNHCFFGCDSSACSAQMGTGLTCNASSGLCECAASTECSLGACSQQSHHCECVVNADCTVAGQDVCVGGTCGCSSAAACPPSVFRNAPPVCD